MTEPIPAKVSTEDYNKIMSVLNQKELTIDEMMDIANQREEANQENIYEYRVIDYCETGCGRTVFLQISRMNSPQYSKRWEQLVYDNYYLTGTEELTETEFLERYTRLIPNAILRLHREKTLSFWQQHFHFNRS